MAQSTESGDVPSLNAQLFRPSLDSQKTIWTDDARFTSTGLSGRAIASWTSSPLVYRAQTGEELSYVDDLLQTNLLASMSWQRARLGIDAPFYLRSFSDLSGDETALGDVSVDGRLGLIERRTGLALSGRLTLPTASTSTLVPLGDEAASTAIALIVDRELGNVLLAANVGAHFGSGVELENVAWDDRLVARLGAGWDLNDRTGASLDFAAQAAISDLSNAAGRPAEVMLGGWRQLKAPFTVRAGVGTGLNGSIGAPKGRLVAEVAYHRPAEEQPVAPMVVSLPPEPAPAPAPAPEPAPEPEPAPVEVAAVEPVPEPPPAVSLAVHFDFDSATLRPGDVAALAEVAALLRSAQDCALEVDGYTDHFGDPAYNLALSERRVAAVAGVLSANGVADGCVTARAHGEQQAHLGASPEQRRMDRRVDVRTPNTH